MCFQRQRRRRTRLVAMTSFPTISRSQRRRLEEVSDPARAEQHFVTALNRISALPPLDGSRAGKLLRAGKPPLLCSIHIRGRRPVARAKRRYTTSHPPPPKRACRNLRPPWNRGDARRDRSARLQSQDAPGKSPLQGVMEAVEVGVNLDDPEPLTEG